MTKAALHFTLRGQRFSLLKERMVYWHDKKTLLIADLHAGKAAHFRKNGIPLSTDHLLADLNIIEQLIPSTQASKICFLGDLYHSTANEENDLIERWITDLGIAAELVIGNHDKYSIHKASIKCTEAYEENGILLSHEPEESDFFNICGHLHPAYVMGGKARSSFKFPSFYLSENCLILPAFGSVNGGKMYKDLVKNAQVILATPEGLIAID